MRVLSQNTGTAPAAELDLHSFKTEYNKQCLASARVAFNMFNRLYLNLNFAIIQI